MLIIPVIDIKHGVVVHAREGRRHDYQAIQSQLINSSDPLEICHHFSEQMNIQQIYIADLDAIMHDQNQHDLVEEILERNPGLCLWLDSGRHFFSDNSIDNDRVIQVLGSEMKFSVNELKQKVAAESVALSLDFTEQGMLGDHSIFDHPDCLPEKIIIMNLDRVGSHKGLNMNRIKTVQQKLPGHHQLYVAGGIQNQADLQNLLHLDVDGVLLASSLHNKSITLT